MADQIKQLAFKEFSIAELQAGTAANVLTTNASTHYVIKGIEATQGDNNAAVTATATLGLTAGLGTAQYASLGTVAQANRTGLSGSAIMDASSTLTIRPTAATINFLDEKAFTQLESSAGTPAKTYLTSVAPSVNGNAEPTLNTETTVDKTGTTYSGSYDSSPNYPSGNYRLLHTNANGVNLILNFNGGSSSGVAFAVWNADTGTQYGYYNESYDRPIFDGKRYIFWVKRHGGSASQVRMRWYDLDESTTNLAAANTTGGGNGANFWHGQTGFFPGSMAHSTTSYDNLLNAFYQNRHTNNKRYFTGYSGSNQRAFLCELPDTLTNDTSTTPAPKWIYLSAASQSSSGSTDPFGNNNSSWSVDYLIKSIRTPTTETQYQLTYDPVISRYMLWYSKDNNEWYAFSFTQADFDTTSTGGLLSPTGSAGLRTIAEASVGSINIDANVIENGGSNNLKLAVGADNSQVAIRSGAYAHNSPTSDMSPCYIDGSNFYFRNMNSASDSAYKVVKLDMSNVTTANLTNLMPNTAVPSNVFRSGVFVSIAAPNSTTIASRAYTKAPALKVRVSGILSDQ